MDVRATDASFFRFITVQAIPPNTAVISTATEPTPNAAAILGRPLMIPL